MKCPNCSKQVRRMVYQQGQWLTPCCSGISEISNTKYESVKTKQRRQHQRDKFGLDLVQPWEVKKGEVTKGWRPNKDYIKQYSNDPDRLSMFSKSELKTSGVVSEKVANKASKGKFNNHIKIADDFSR